MTLPWAYISLALLMLFLCAGVYEIMALRRTRARVETREASDSATPTAGAISAPEPAVHQVPATVLIVENDAQNAMDLQVRIAKRHPDWQVIQTQSGRLDLKLVHTGGVDVVVVDLDLPVTEGRQLVQRMSVTDVPVIFVGTSVSDYSRSKPGQQFIQSALDSSEVVEAVETAVPGKAG
jgi:CheY-like chemotaxis protein